MNHTPTPWGIIFKYDEKEKKWAYYIESVKHTAPCTKEEAKANARLIVDRVNKGGDA